jgi:hypothetical protein
MDCRALRTTNWETTEVGSAYLPENQRGKAGGATIKGRKSNQNYTLQMKHVRNLLTTHQTRLRKGEHCAYVMLGHYRIV